MFGNQKFIKFIQKAEKAKKDIVCINILEAGSSHCKISTSTIFINSSGEYIGIESDSYFKEFIVNSSKDILLEKKGKYVHYNEHIKLWIEPFYYDEDYSSIGKALKNVLNGISTTLVRSLKHSGAHGFTPTFDKEDNIFNKNENLFYQKIESPFKVLILGVGTECENLLKAIDSFGWYTSVCDTKGSNFKYIKSADEIILLDIPENIVKVTNKGFDTVIIMAHTLKNTSLYLETLIKSNIKSINIVASKKQDMIDDKKVVYFERLSSTSPERDALVLCSEIKSKMNKSIDLSIKEKNEVINHAY